MKAIFSVMIVIAALIPVVLAQATQQEKVSPLQRLDERELRAQPKESSSRVYRLIIAPTWGKRICFRVENTPTSAVLVMKRLSGQAGYGDGPLEETKTIPLTVAEFADFEAVVAKSGFEQMGVKDPGMGLDGDSWRLEASKAGFYHQSSRWCPNIDAKKRKTEGYVEVFRWVADKMGVTKTITNKGSCIFDR